MQLRHPSAFYLFYLLSKRRFRLRARYTEGAQSEHLLKVLEAEGIPVPRKAHQVEYLRADLQRITERMQVPTDMRRLQVGEAARFLRQWRIADLWNKRPNAIAAHEILKNAALRRTLEVMLLGPIGRADIASYLQSRWDLPREKMSTGVVRMYEHYFWNVERLSIPEWETFIREHIEWPFDDYLAAATAKRDQGGIALTLHVADRGGSGSLKPIPMYETMRSHMYSTFMHHANLGKPGFNNTMAMTASIKTIFELDEQLERLRGGSVEVLEQFDRIQEAYDPNKPLTVRALPVDRPVSPEEVIETEAE